MSSSASGPNTSKTPHLIDTYQRMRALVFEVDVELVESLGAEKYVHFTVQGASAHSAHLAELAADSGISENEFVARLPAQSAAMAGERTEVALDTTKLAIFDADTGANLTIPPATG